MILYSATRFPVEFLSAAHEKVLGPFNTYHFLCIAGIIIGLAMLLIVKRFGEKIAEIYEKPHEKFALKMAQKEEQKALNLAEEKAKAEADEVARKEKVRLARERAKARKK
jgi:signal transduction histidine kinase